ncbi:MAG: hypothetical protein R3E31_00810 [Chloroflexota bacterium]
MLSSIPLATPDAAQQQIRLQGDVPSQINKPSGCPFHPAALVIWAKFAPEKHRPGKRTRTANAYFATFPYLN